MVRIQNHFNYKVGTATRPEVGLFLFYVDIIFYNFKILSFFKGPNIVFLFANIDSKNIKANDN